MCFRALAVFSLFLSYALLGSAEQCGSQAGGALCPEGLCCSQWGWCGSTDDYCKKENGCQSQCEGDDTGGGDDDDDDTGGDTGGGLADIITREIFEKMLPYRNDPRCHAVGFYTYNAFIAAAKSYPAFATTGDDATRKREVAAFLGQTSHETTGGPGWDPPGGPYLWGYCYNKEVNPPSDYCDWTNLEYPCASGQQYYGRGPIQLSWNYNYGPFGASVGQDLLQNPGRLLSNITLSYESAFWFWMTPQPPKPSCHEVITGEWTPSARDVAAGRLPGYGVITNIINGGIECGKGWNAAGEDRIGFYKRYCDMLGVSYGEYLDCHSQRPFSEGLLVNINDVIIKTVI
ncbi:endochitinase 1-like [Durio zibethinus]|uniref:Endochitinase 1-like n=1 Tax=Durio zibethinus TaxID=66656 RepID=A0A6P6ADL8_DURZI|nr:endochitinase 1-like [Durio zibethinus]